MKEKPHAMINPDLCDTCIHNSVCSYKQDFRDICNALAGCEVVKQLGSQGMSSKKVTLYGILDKVIIKCKHYYNGEKIRMDPNGGITFQSCPRANLCDYSTVSVASDTSNSVTTISNATKAKIDPPSNLETTTDYIFR